MNKIGYEFSNDNGKTWYLSKVPGGPQVRGALAYPAINQVKFNSTLWRKAKKCPHCKRSF